MTGDSREIGIGLVGYGHWGPNHVRVFNQLEACRVLVVAAGRPGGWRPSAATRPGP
jgi:hypothetical protein